MRSSRNRLLRLQGLLVFILAFSTPCVHGGHMNADASRRMLDEPSGMFDLEVAPLYENLHRWKEAEQEYLQAGRIGAPSVKKEALAAIERLKVHRPTDEESFELELGKLYEDDRNWKEAEQHYAAAAEDAPQAIRNKALGNIKRVREHRRLEEFVEDFDRWLGYVARILAIAFFFVIIWRIVRTRGAIEVMPFEASSDDAMKRVAFFMSSAREELPTVIAPVLAVGEANVVDSIPLIILPGVENEFPDPAEDIEVGEIKLPLANWVRLVKRPLIRVFGRWNVGATRGIAQARIMHREWCGYSESASSRFAVPSAAGLAQDRQLTFFVYDVLIKAVFLRRYGP